MTFCWVGDGLYEEEHMRRVRYGNLHTSWMMLNNTNKTGKHNVVWWWEFIVFKYNMRITVVKVNTSEMLWMIWKQENHQQTLVKLNNSNDKQLKKKLLWGY